MTAIFVAIVLLLQAYTFSVTDWIENRCTKMACYWVDNLQSYSIPIFYNINEC